MAFRGKKLSRSYEFQKSEIKQSMRTKAVSVAESGIGADGCLLPSPSGINTLSKPLQACVVLGIIAGLSGGTIGLVALEDYIKILVPQLMSGFISNGFLLGPIFTLAGIAHFTVKDDFCNIMPPNGTWGIWYLPGNASFHVIWTGIAEIILGLWLTIGGVSQLAGLSLPSFLDNSIPNAASCLLLLTIAVTPANIYSYTHGARLPMSLPSPPVTTHYIRLLLQIVLFAAFYQLGRPVTKMRTALGTQANLSKAGFSCKFKPTLLNAGSFS
eukprot:gene2594-5070_t